MMSLFFFQTPESKKQEFRKYLEKSGVIDALTKGNQTHYFHFNLSFTKEDQSSLIMPDLIILYILCYIYIIYIYTYIYIHIYIVLVGLYEEPERPQNAVDYIKRYMGAPTGVDIDAIRLENEKLKKELAALQDQLKNAKT